MENGDKIPNYYEIYLLQRGASREDLYRQLKLKRSELENKQDMARSNENKKVLESIVKYLSELSAAIKVFRNDKRFEEYNKQLDAAIAKGTVDTEYQAQLLASLDEIERLFYQEGNYGAVINRCQQLISEDGASVKLYDFLSRGYYMYKDNENAMRVAEECAKSFSHDIDAFDIAVRMSIKAAKDIDKAQRYMNIMLEKFDNGFMAALDQAYILMAQNNLDMGFRVVDDYIKEHPSDKNFRTRAAYDMISFGNDMFTREDDRNSQSISYLNTQEEYDICKRYADKAGEICNDEVIQQYVKEVEYFGQTEFNEDNKGALTEMLKGLGVMVIGMALLIKFGGPKGIFSLTGIAVIAWTVALLFVYVNLRAVSYRQYWQINKYYMTGERLPKEKLFITIGKILVFYFAFSSKVFSGMVKGALRLFFRW